MINRLLISLFLIFVCGSTYAHHGNSEFDLSKIVDVQGVVTKFEWRNPHAYLYLRITDAEGQEHELRIESATPSALVAYGVNLDSFSQGEKVTVTGLLSPSSIYMNMLLGMINAFSWSILDSATDLRSANTR